MSRDAYDYTEFYLREARRLRDLADVFVCSDTRAQMERLIHQYEILAGQTLDGKAVSDIGPAPGP